MIVCKVTLRSLCDNCTGKIQGKRMYISKRLDFFDKQGRVVRKPVNTNPGLKVNRKYLFFAEIFFSLLISCVVCAYSDSEQKDKQYKQKTIPKSCKKQINPKLA